MSETTQKLYNLEGAEVGLVTLPDAVFSRPINATLLSEAVTGMQRNLQVPTSHAKGRAEVRGGGRKPWRQKGTGRARHGSIRSPIWRGGGVTHGPLKNRTYTRKINKKVKDASLAMALSGKQKDNELFFVQELSLPKPRTKDMVTLLSRLLEEAHEKGSVLVVMDEVTSDVAKSVNNISHVALANAHAVSALDILSFRYIVITEQALKTLIKRLS